jgi:hypothetical protein
MAVALDSTISWIVFMPDQTPEKRLMAKACMPRSRISCTRREEHRRAAGLEDVVALVRGGGALGDMVVTGHGNHAAPGRGAGHVGVLEHVEQRSTPGPLPYQMPNTPSNLLVPGGAKPSCCVPHSAVAASSSFTPGWNTMFCAFR